jgi:mono/diheme cytochrome c family protein
MYHGIIEHVIFIVPWLTKQIEQRKLYEGNDHGRIWRIVHENGIKREKWSDGDLVKMLGHPNGWQRNTAQRLLVERGEDIGDPNRFETPLHRLHALWTLEGMGKLKPEHLQKAAKDADSRVRAAAARLGAEIALSEEPDASVRIHALLSPKPLLVIAEHLTRHEDDLSRIAAMTTIHGKEIALLELLLKWPQNTAHRVETLKLLCQLACMDGKAEAILARMAETVVWQREALLDGFLASQAKVTLKAKPAFLDELAANRDIAARERLQKLRTALTWPGADVLPITTRKLSEAAKQQIERGAAVYQSVCGLCHQPTGYGVPNVAPPLAESSWVTGEPERLIRIALHGLYGEIEVNGQKWNLAMPGQGMNPLLDDAKLADVLSYIRNAWGNEAEPIAVAQIAAVREQTKDRKMPWTADTLLQVDVRSENAIQPDADGVLTLPAIAAKTYGQKLAYRPSLNVLAPWRIETDVAEWTIQIPADGEYEVFVTLAADEASAGDAYVIEAETATAKGTVKSTGGYEIFAEQSAGILKLKLGMQKLLMRPDGALKQELADVRMVRLRRR